MRQGCNLFELIRGENYVSILFCVKLAGLACTLTKQICALIFSWCTEWGPLFLYMFLRESESQRCAEALRLRYAMQAI